MASFRAVTLAVLLVCGGAMFAEGMSMAGSEPMMTSTDMGCMTVAETAVAGNFTLLVAALEAVNLTDYFSSPSLNVTVFAPTDAAFMAALSDLNLTAAGLLGAPELLMSVLEAHVVPMPVDCLEDGMMLPTLAKDEMLEIVQTPTGFVVKSSGTNATVLTEEPVDACMSYIYPIDYVLAPAMDLAMIMAPAISTAGK